jgi:F-type H+-transporting ATPase subunit b
MPQIAQLAETFASQIFWMLVFFGFVFFVIGRGMVPKVMATVESRDRQVATDLAAAQAARTAADAQEEAWRVQANTQRAQAQALIAQAKGEATKAAEIRLAAAASKIDAQVEAAETRIAAARQGALGEIEAVAVEAATDIAQRLAGLTVDAGAAKSAVKEALHV